MADRRTEFAEQAAELSGSCIYQAMKAAGLNETELAERSGTSRPNLSRYINSRTVPSLPILLKILEACGQQIKELPLSYIQKHT